MFSKDLERYGPQAAHQKPLTRRQSRRYCRRLARRHYENFTVASRLIPHRLRQHVCNLYAYCRWADDLADEIDDPQQSLALLAWWEAQLRDCYRDRVAHPVFVALAETIGKFNIPPEPFVDLLVAFRQDQRLTRYESQEQLLEYCRYSANPVGRMVLYLGECHTPDRVRLADSICTGLQLANFCQDVARDWDRGRVYLPQAACRRFGYSEAMFARRECNDAFRQLLAAPRRSGRRLAPRRSAVGRQDAAWVATAGDAVCPRRAGHAGGDSPAELRCVVASADGFHVPEAATLGPLLVEVPLRRLKGNPMNPSRDAVETSYRFCRRSSRRAGSSFHAGFMLLPREKRQAMEALYAFMRHTDDLVDDPSGCPEAACAVGVPPAPADETAAPQNPDAIFERPLTPQPVVAIADPRREALTAWRGVGTGTRRSP